MHTHDVIHVISQDKSYVSLEYARSHALQLNWKDYTPGTVIANE